MRVATSGTVFCWYASNAGVTRQWFSTLWYRMWDPSSNSSISNGPVPAGFFSMPSNPSAAHWASLRIKTFPCCALAMNAPSALGPFEPMTKV